MNSPIELYQAPGAGGRALTVIAPDLTDPATNDRLDLRAFLTTLRRRLGLFALVTGTIFALVLFITLDQHPTYVATAEVALNTTAETIAPNATGGGDAEAQPNDAMAETEVRVLASREMAASVSRSLGLERDATFNPLLRRQVGRLDRLLARVGLASPEPFVAPTADASREAVLDKLQRGLTVTRLGTSLSFTIAFEAGDPTFAARIANEYARRYTLGALDAKQAFNRQSRDFLARRLDELRAQANADNERVQQYRVAANLLSTSGASLTEQEISAYNQGVAQARAQAAEDVARLATARAQLRNGSTGDDVGEALGSGVVSALRSRQAEASAQLAILRARYGALHPEVKKAESELAEVNANIAAEIKRVISNLEAKASVSRERLGSISGSLAGARGTLAQNNKAAVTLDDLQRRADASQQLYESYLNRYKETSAREGAERPDARILTLAEVPRDPASPNVPLQLLLGLVVGAGLGLVAALLAEAMYPGITTGEEAEKRLHVRYLGGVPLLGSLLRRGPAPADAVVTLPHSGFAEAFRTLRTSLPYAVAGPVQTVAITSALPGEGKTTIAVCLARVAGLAGEAVILVDCDLRRRGSSLALPADAAGPGLIEVLRGEATLDQAITVDAASGARLLRLNPAAADAGDLLKGEAMDRLLDELKAHFSLVVLDAPPLLPIAYARLIAAKADATVFVVRWRGTADHVAKAALRLLPVNHVRLAGVVLGQIDMRKQRRFGHGDAGSYYGKYKDYYA